MKCERCGRDFDEKLHDYCGYCRTVHTPDGKSVRTIATVLKYITAKFGADVLLDRRRTDALIADFFPKEDAIRKLTFITLYDGTAAKLISVKEKPFEVRSAAAAKCVKSLRDGIGMKGRIATEAVEAVALAVGCEISFHKPSSTPAAATESKKNITDSAEQYSLGRHFDRLKIFDKALYWFEQSALGDCGEAQYYLGYYLLESRGCGQDVPQAREWFLRGAENNIPAAQYMTGYFYAEGIECELNEAVAFDWFMKAARAGYGEAINVIALCYENGVYVRKNEEIAAKWRSLTEGEEVTEEFLAAVEDHPEPPIPPADDGEELYRAARRCIAENDAEGAAMFYRRAAELGHAKAQCSYGKCLYKGAGVEQDNAQAFWWFMKAAAQGLDIAEYNLGVMFLKGVHVEKNKDLALEHFQRAADMGHEEALKLVKKMK